MMKKNSVSGSVFTTTLALSLSAMPLKASESTMNDPYIDGFKALNIKHC